VDALLATRTHAILVNRITISRMVPALPVPLTARFVPKILVSIALTITISPAIHATLAQKTVSTVSARAATAVRMVTISKGVSVLSAQQAVSLALLQRGAILA
jgi:hypothetical protein